MRKRITYRIISFAFVCMLMLQTKNSYAQWTLDVSGSVKKVETKKRMEGATITIKKNGSVWKTLTSPSNGKFEVSLLPDAVYVIEFSKPGHVTKRMQLSTKNVPPDDAKYGFDFPMEMNLFEKMDGLDVSILNQPIAKVAFNPETGYMDYDAAYTKSIKKELDRLIKELADRLKAEEENRKTHQKEYDAAIAKADKAYNAEKWAEAKPLYEKALAIFPNETYPDFQLGDISDKLVDLEKGEKKYNSAIERADKAFAAREWEKAINEYEIALTLKEKEKYPTDKIKEIKTIVANEKKVSKDYNDAIALADQYFLNKDYDNSKNEYQKASDLKSYEEYPKEKIKEIESLLAEKEKKDKEYNDAIAEADTQFGAKEYDKSIELYNKALGFKSEEVYPKERIENAKRLILEEQEKEENYKKFIADADAALGTKDYVTATSNYEEAIRLKEDEKYPKDKLSEIKGLLEASAKLDAEYANFIKAADLALESKKYDVAKTAYEKALGLKSEEQYPKDKLTELEGLLAELAKQEVEKAAKEAEYKKVIVAADKLLSGKKYDDAKAKYTEALTLKSEEQYPKDKITEIDGLLAELAKNEAEKAVNEAKYLAVITAADNLLKDKNYETAKGKYTEALSLKSEEKYPKEKIAEIDILLENLAKEAADAKAKEEQYLALITTADNSLKEKSYKEAKGKYTEALTVKPAEQYPKDKIIEIEGLLADLAKQEAEKLAKEKSVKELQALYDGLITEGDKRFKTQKYDDALSKYKEALLLKTNEQYPKDKIIEIEGLLAEIAKKEAEAAAAKLADGEKDAKYQEAIILADNAFGFKNYKQSKLKYNEALAIKPTEQYPKDRIKAIDEALAALAKQKEEDDLAAESDRKKKEYFDALVAEADAELVGKNYTEATSKYNQALGVIPNEQYPKDKIQEIKTILAQLDAEKNNAALAKSELDKKYNTFIAQGDNTFGTKNYASAKIKYNAALNLKNTEAYPKSQLVEIERLLAEIAAKESKITLTNNALKQKEEQYNSFIKAADKELLAKRYNKAISQYEQALGLMPTKAYPKEKIDEITQILADIAKQQRDSKNSALAEKEKREEYNKYIYDADRAMKLKEYTKAQVNYKGALNLYETEKYPKNKLAEIIEILKKQNEVKEEIVVVNTSTGSRAKINDVQERDIEARMAALLGKTIIQKDEALQNDKDNYIAQEEIRISGGIERTEDANKKLDQYEEGIKEQTERGNKLHLQNSETLLATTKLLEKAKQNRIKAADKRRNDADESFEVYQKEQAIFVKEQEKLSEDKVEAHYIYVDNLKEADILMKESGEKTRANNRKDIKQLTNNDKESKLRNKKRREEMALDVKKYKAEVAQEESIRISASIDRTAAYGNEIKEVNDGMIKMKSEKINYYKLNVQELIKFKERIDNLENERIKKANETRENNQKINDKIVADYKRNTKRQTERYYDDVEDVKAYKESVGKYELTNQKKADKRRVGSNKKVLTAMENLNAPPQGQEERYKEFKRKLDEERKNNQTFMSDLKTVEREKTLLADAALDDFYMGEKQPRLNEELSGKYPQGITEETRESGNSITIVRTKVTGKQVDVYERVFYAWGGTFFYKNGANITQILWDKESIE